uniref:Uncharacterized protein n=1 Tax=Lygus hesperus TaxID=30085 RepID=A0A0K8T3E7_LYGHE
MGSGMEDRKNWFDSMASILEQNTVGVKLGIYGLGLAGCWYAIRSVRPFTKFRTPRDVPKSFYESRIRLSGQVVGMRFLPDSTLLLVDHRPVLLAKLRERGALPVSIEGVNITSNGVCWLQTIVKDDEIDFQLLEPKGETAVSCLVYHKNHDVAKRLVDLGFASVAPFNHSFENDPNYSQYYKELLKLESKAERKKVACGGTTKHTTLSRVQSSGN